MVTASKSEHVQANDDGFFKLPDGLKPNVDYSGELPAAHHEDEPPARHTAPDDDFWLSQQTDATHRPVFKSWAAFRREQSDKSTVAFISESGPEVFDSLLASEEFSHGPEAQ